jgi:hypothetical protein
METVTAKQIHAELDNEADLLVSDRRKEKEALIWKISNENDDL